MKKKTNNINMEEAYCSLEVSKLLKENGFNEEIYTYYIPFEDGDVSFIVSSNKTNYNALNDYPWIISAPTHQMAEAWLREKHDLHIIAYPYKAGNERKWCCQVYKTYNLLGYEKYTNETLDTYPGAVEAALKYCLENLI